MSAASMATWHIRRPGTQRDLRLGVRAALPSWVHPGQVRLCETCFATLKGISPADAADAMELAFHEGAGR